VSLAKLAQTKPYQEGDLNARTEIAMNLLGTGMGIEQVAIYTGLSVRVVWEVQGKIR
jgi:microcompartment protein CcmK/EutM